MEPLCERGTGVSPVSRMGVSPMELLCERGTGVSPVSRMGVSPMELLCERGTGVSPMEPLPKRPEAGGVLMKWIDISIPLCPGCRQWPGDRPFEHAFTSRIADGSDYNSSILACSAHVGTHVDAPYHVLPIGATVDKLDPSIFVGPALVVDIQTPGHISAKHLEEKIQKWPQRLLLRTRNSAPGGALSHGGFDPTYCALEPDAANLIARRGLQLLGIDYNSVEPYEKGSDVHKAILGAGIVTLEGLDLRDIQPGEYSLVAVPLRLRDFDASPVRALLGQA